MYRIVFTEDARKDLKELQKKAPQAITKLAKLLDELKEHRIVYRIYDNIVEVLVLSVFGHYR